jgi:tetratricopeptide (TPR) repeat protein
MARLRLSVILLLLAIVSSIARNQLALSQQASAFPWETVPKTTARDLLIGGFRAGPMNLQAPVAYAQLIPAEAELPFLHGKSLMRRKLYHDAVKCFTDITEAHPRCYPALVYQGTVYYLLHDDAHALACYKQAQKLMPDISVAYESEGSVYYREHQVEKAIRYFKMAIEISPLPSTYLWLAGCYKEMGKPHKMMEMFMKSANLPDPSGYTDLALAGVALDENHADDALRHVRDAMQKAPDDSHMYAFAAACLIQQKKLDEALEQYELAATIDPYEPAYRDRIAQTLNQLSRSDEAIDNFRKAIEMDPARASTYAHEGNCLKGLQRYDKAMELYKKAIELEPKNAVWQRGAGDCLYDQHKYEDAATHYEEAARLDPKDWVSLHSLAWCYEFMDRDSDAERVRRQSEKVPGEKEAMQRAMDKLRAELKQQDKRPPKSDDSLPIQLH